MSDTLEENYIDKNIYLSRSFSLRSNIISILIGVKTITYATSGANAVWH
jgi:hypothetical protein